MNMSLTPGAVAALFNPDGSIPQPCYLQCTGIKAIAGPNNGPAERYRVMLSDGIHFQWCFLATQLLEKVKSGELREGSIVDIKEHVCNKVEEPQKKLIVIVIKMEISASAPKIGNPIQLNVNLDASGMRQPDFGHSVVKHGGPPPPQVNGAPPGAGYGAPPPAMNGGYGAPPPAAAGPGGYGQPPPQNVYGGGGGMPPVNNNMNGAGGYGGPPPGAGPYGGGGGGGGPPAAAPYGAPPPQHHQQQNQQQGGQGGGMAPRGPYGGGGGNMGGGGGGGGAMPPQYRAVGGGATVRNEAPAVITDIDALNPYQNRWTVKARVTQKSDIRRYTNARGEGKFFSFDLLDAKGGEIRVVCWNEMCDRFHDQVDKGRVYLISKASLRNKRGNFNQTRHQYEIHLDNNSQLDPVDDEASIPQIRFQFVPIASLEDAAQNSSVDVIGIVETAGDWSTINRRDGSEAHKRSITIRDTSGRSIELTMWGQYVQDPGEQIQQMVQQGHHPVLAVKAAKVGDYNGKTLSTTGSSVCAVNPVDEPEAGRLRSWYDSTGLHEQAQAMSMQRGGGGRQDRRIALSAIKEEGLGQGGQPAWIQTLGYVGYIRNEGTWCYPACPLSFNGKTCNKKLTDHGDGNWQCERCNQSAQPDWRYILSCKLQDHTAEEWCTAFNESAPQIMGISAGELKELQERSPPAYEATYSKANLGMYLFKLKAAEDSYNDEMRVRLTIVKAEPVDFVRESKWLLDGITKLEQQQDPFAPIAPAGGAAPGVGGGMYGGQQQQQQFNAPAAAGGYGGGGGGGYQQPAYGGAPQQQQQFNQPQQQFNQPAAQGYGAGGAGAGGGMYGGGGGQQGGGGGWQNNNNANQWGAAAGGGGGGGGYGGGGY